MIKNRTKTFDDIRSYNDDEVIPTLDSLKGDREFKQSMNLLSQSNVKPVLRPLIRVLFPLLWPILWGQLVKGISDVHSMQIKVKRLLLKSLNSSSEGVQCEGIEQLDNEKPYLFISNHRDIAMDPALINLMLSNANFGIPQLAIGDNLLSKPFASDIMRLNRSFIVKRNVQSGRQLLAELKHLSKYIQYLKNEERSNVWIAQREGRSKDGIDKTDEAVLKMLLLSADKKLPLSEQIKQLQIVPVTISYEWDPCDIEKAQSMIIDGYTKAEHEDIATIGTGIRGYKGHIQVNFSPCIEVDFESIDQLANFIDRQINERYQLYPSHFAACQLLNIDYSNLTVIPNQTDIDTAKQQFSTRLAGQDGKIVDRVLHNYANSLINVSN